MRGGQGVQCAGRKAGGEALARRSGGQGQTVLNDSWIYGIQGQGKVLTAVKIGLCGAMRQGPVAFAAIGGLNNDGQADIPRVGSRQHLSAKQCVKLKAVVQMADGDLRSGRDNEGWVTHPVVGKAVVCPLSGGGEIEFPVFPTVDRSDEGFAASVLPETIGFSGWAFDGQQDVGRVAVKTVA